MPYSDELTPLSSQQLLEEAVTIAEKILRSAILSSQSLTWLTAAQPDLQQLKPISHNLFDGSTGVALFLGALARATGESKYRDLALAALAEWRANLDPPTIQRAAGLRDQIGLGSAVGIGAIVYACVRLSQFLADDTFLKDANRWAALITPELITTDHHYDLFSGSAGAIVGLLALYDHSPDQSLLERALACGQHLLKTRVASSSGYRAWPFANNAILTGFSHGAAGIAYALLRLYERAPDLQFLEAAREAIAYERSVFSAQAGNWPDFLATISDRPRFRVSWCHGAPGVALARLATLKLLNTEDIQQDIAIGLQTTRRYLFDRNAVDHLCCGTLGRAETIFKAGQVLSYPEMTEVALKAATQVVLRAKRRGMYQLGTLAQPIHDVGLFQGLSGIGYQFLRFAHPELFPSVLLWE